ncbi:MAG: hypothetical protein O2931_12860, partial [Planctomycetota bacterium]|nr:hypothetical protein [Planctomycetota bacterium]
MPKKPPREHVGAIFPAKDDCETIRIQVHENGLAHIPENFDDLLKNRSELTPRERVHRFRDEAKQYIEANCDKLTPDADYPEGRAAIYLEGGRYLLLEGREQTFRDAYHAYCIARLALSRKHDSHLSGFLHGLEAGHAAARSFARRFEP